MTLSRETLQGSIPAVVTPFAPAGEITKGAFIKKPHHGFFHHTHLLHRLGMRVAVLAGRSHLLMTCAGLGLLPA